MLSELRITNLGVIAEANVELYPGLTVITGETGAGKTMLVSSLQLLIGQRADSSKVRVGSPDTAAEARVEGRFETTALPSTVEAEVQHVLAECGAQADEDGSIIAARTVRSDGRSRAHLGGRSVPAGTLASFTQPLLTIHGQHDQLRLLNSSQQREALDHFGGATIHPLLDTYQQVRRQWRSVSRELQERLTQGQERARELAHLTAAVQEIDEVGLEPGEDHRLQEDIRRLMDADELREAAGLATFRMSGDSTYLTAAEQGTKQGMEQVRDASQNATDIVGETRDTLQATSDTVLQGYAQQLDGALAIITEVSADLRSYLDELDVDPATLEAKLARQAAVKAIVRKYGVDVDDVLRWRREAAVRIAHLDTSATTVDELRAEVERLTVELREAARALTAARRTAARQLQQAVTTVLRGLAMDKASFTIAVAPLAETTKDKLAQQFSVSGADEVSFLLAAHAGATPQPITKAASGGELSRLMLALEVVLAQDDYGRTLIFDEVDSGIGGATALEVGRCLARLAHIHQVLVVTHLPQVAAFADHHLTVTKDTSADRAVTTINHLADEARVTELARMLAGMEDTETGKAHARELWETATSLKTAE